MMRSRCSCPSLLCAAVVACWACSAMPGGAAAQKAGPPAAAPVYEAARTAAPITVDGRLDEPVWQRATPITTFVNNADGTPTPLQTDARIVYDEAFVYFAFRVVDRNIWATMKQRDEHLWEEEVVEVFLQPDEKRPGYIELEVNPLGAMIDIFLVDVRVPLKYASWNSDKLKWAVQVKGTVDGKEDDQEWTTEMALPLEDVPGVKAKAGDRWKMNLYRVEKRPAPAGLAWSATMKNDFHLPAKWGTLVFSDRVIP